MVTLLYGGLPNSSRWYDVAPAGATVGSRAVLYLRRRDGVSARRFRNVVNTQLVPAMTAAGSLQELRTQTFLPWNKKLWDTPNVAHDNPKGQRFHASVILGFADDAAREAFFSSQGVTDLSENLKPLVAAIHAYDVTAALTYVKNGRALTHYEEA